MVEFVPKVVDVSHYEEIEDGGWKKAKDAGIIGMIAKATQGTHYQDPTFEDMVRDADLEDILVGAYHFNTAEDPIKQADYFLETTRLNDFDTSEFLYALDYEANPRSDMNIHQAVTFLHRIEEKIGRKAVIYSGNKLKETIDDLNKADRDYVCSHKLWLAQYNYRFRLPKGFDHFFLWQFTGDGFGPSPHWVPGIKCPGNKGLDLNVFNGTDDELREQWAT